MFARSLHSPRKDRPDFATRSAVHRPGNASTAAASIVPVKAIYPEDDFRPIGSGSFLNVACCERKSNHSASIAARNLRFAQALNARLTPPIAREADSRRAEASHRSRMCAWVLTIDVLTPAAASTSSANFFVSGFDIENGQCYCEREAGAAAR